MANLCINSIVFYSSDREALSVLRIYIIGTMAPFGSGEVRDLLIKLGYQKREAEELAQARNSIVHCNEVEKLDDGAYYLMFQTESAWVPHVEPFEHLLKTRYANRIKMVYCSEECGMEVYVNTDVQGIFFPERFLVDCSYKGEYYTLYLDTYKEVIEWVHEIFPQAKVSLDSDIYEVEQAVEPYAGEGDDYFRLYEFDYGEERSAA